MRLRSSVRTGNSDRKVEVKVGEPCIKKAKKRREEKLSALKRNEPVAVKKRVVVAKKISYCDHRESSNLSSLLNEKELSSIGSIHQDQKDSVVERDHLITSTSTTEKKTSFKNDTHSFKSSGDDAKPNTKVFKRRAIIASTPLVSSLPCNELLAARLKTDLSGSYWSADSHLSKSSIHADSPRTSSGRKTCPVRKLQYFPEDSVPTKKVEVDNIPKKKRRVSTSAKKVNATMKKRRLSTSGKNKDNPYKRGGLLKSYLSNACNFSMVKSGTETKASKPPSKPEPLMNKEKNKPTVKYQSFATERLLAKQNSKYLSKTFTAINSKVNSNQSFAHLPNASFLPNASYLPNVSYLPNESSNLNKTEVSLLNRKRRKKLYTLKSDKFNKSPGIAPESLLNPSMLKNSFAESRKRNKNISFKTRFKDIIEDSDKENEEFSSIKVDDEISFRQRTNTSNETRGKKKSDVSKEATSTEKTAEGSQDTDFIIRSRPKTITSIEAINDKFNGSYLPDPKERCITDNNERSELKVSSCSLKTISETETENKEEALNEDGKMKRFKKKKLFQKKELVFDLEASNEGNTTFDPNMTCNQSIMASIINFNQ